MKSQTKRFLTLLLVLTATFTLTANPVMSKDKMIVKIKSHTQSIGVQIANLQKHRTQISIVDVNGKSWFSQFIWKENGYSKKLMLAGMPEGTYILFIKNKKENHMQAFVKTDYDITFFKTQSVGKKKDGVALLTSNDVGAQSNLITKITTPSSMKVGIQLANLQKKEVSIRLNTLGGTPILKDKVSGENGYAKKINVEGMTRGNYYFLIRTGNAVQIQFFTITNNGVKLNDRQILEDPSLISELVAK